WRRPVPAESTAATDKEAASLQGGRAEAAPLAPWLTGWLAARLELPVQAIDPDRGFAELGLDSVGSTELAFALGERLGLDLPETIAFNHPTVARMVAHLTPRSPASAARDIPSPASIAAPAVGGSDLDDLLTAIERGEA